MVLTIIVIAAAVIVFWGIITFNRLVTLRNRAKEALSDISIQLKRRYNLIPNLINTVKGYASHEKQVLENVTRARTRAMNAGTIKDQATAENALTSTLKTLFAVSENYPQLKASSNFLELQRELRDTEDKIQASRRFYNANVRDLNIKIEHFPANLVANLFRFKQMDLFELEEAAAKQVPEVKF